MADNFTSYVGLYLAKNDKDLSSLTESINNIRNECLNTCEIYSIFTINENTQMDSAQFDEMVNNASQSVESFNQEDLNTLFEVFDKDSDGVLNYDELSVLQTSDNDGTITDFSFWSTINNYSNASVANFKSLNLKENFAKDEKYKTAYEDIYGEGTADLVKDGPQEVIPQDLSTDDLAKIAAKIANGEMSLEYYADLLTEDSYKSLSDMVDKMEDALNNQTEETSEPEETSETGETQSEYGKDEIDTLKDQIYDIIMASDTDNYKCPEDVISELLKAGTIDKETAEELRYSYMTFSSEDDGKIDAKLKLLQLINPDATRMDAIKALQESGEIGAPKTDADTPLDALDDNNEISIDVDAYVEQLHDAMDGLGTDEDALQTLLYNENITNEEFVEVVAAYEKKYGLEAGGVSLITRIEQETSGDLQSQLTNVIGIRLADAANYADKYDSKAIDIIAKELYGGTAGQFCTADDFLKGVFDYIDDKALAKVDKRYSEVNGGRDLIDDIKADHAGFLGWRNWFGWNVPASGNGATYISQIQRARTLKI